MGIFNLIEPFSPTYLSNSIIFFIMGFYNSMIHSSAIKYAAIAQFVLFTVTWMVSIPMKDVSIVDITWGLAFVSQALFYYLFSENPTWEQLVFTILICLSGLRLAIHIGIRKMYEGEDKRLKVLFRDKWGSNFWWISYFIVFLPQLLINMIIGLAIYAFNFAHYRYETCPYRYAFGTFLMVFGLVWQAVGDAQLQNFKIKPENRDKLYTGGLWKLSRHPNYIGDTLFWWGVYAINLSAYVGITIFSPLLLNILLRFLSGVPVTERFLLEHYGDKYRAYQRTTNTFLPWFPSQNKEVLDDPINA